MNLLRNADVRRLLVLLLIPAILAWVLALLLHPVAGLLAVVTTLLLTSVFLVYTARRYRDIDHLTRYLQRIAHGDYSMDIRDNTEGELSILRNELYKLTVALREQNDALEQDKNRLSDALSDISHQLKTPLTSLSVLTDLLGSDHLSADNRMLFTGRMRTQLDRLEWLVTALLTLSRLDAAAVVFQRVPVPFHCLLQKASAPLLIQAELREVCLNLNASDGTVLCDENWTSEALLNILKNCIEHTPTGGSVTASLDSNPLYAQIRIEDSGDGIDPEDLPHIFNRFYRGKNAAGDSAGIGLAMAAAIVEGQDGTIQAGPARTGGSVFTIRFPV